jgi:hypothetical protein
MAKVTSNGTMISFFHAIHTGGSKLHEGNGARFHNSSTFEQCSALVPVSLILAVSILAVHVVLIS